MKERLKQILERFRMFWNKYTNRKKTIIICAGTGIILAFTLLTVYLFKPTYVQFTSIMDSDQANAMVRDLESKDIDFKKSVKNDLIIIRSK